MDPVDPIDAQQIVAAYVRLLERDLEQARHPARLETLPFAKAVIRTALQTCTRTIVACGQMTDELREFLATAYESLAEYVEPELVELIASYRAAADDLTSISPVSREKTASGSWRAVAEASPIAGEIARAIADEADSLRNEFRALIAPPA
jgi:hypothetical protein